jgi:uncharacterized protein
MWPHGGENGTGRYSRAERSSISLSPRCSTRASADRDAAGRAYRAPGAHLADRTLRLAHGGRESAVGVDLSRPDYVEWYPAPTARTRCRQSIRRFTQRSCCGRPRVIIYADTSALVKLFVTEANSNDTRRILQDAQALGTGLLTRAELGAAFARGVRRGILREEQALEARRWLSLVWPTWVIISIYDAIVTRAESLAWLYGLRGYDAVHLASALVWQEQLAHAITLATFDQELWEAAGSAGLDVWPVSAPVQTYTDIKQRAGYPRSPVAPEPTPRPSEPAAACRGSAS